MQMGAKVTYPGLREHRQHELLNRLRNADYGCGGMLTIDFGSQQVRAMNPPMNSAKNSLVSSSSPLPGLSWLAEPECRSEF